MILYLLVTDKKSTSIKKWAFIYLLISLFCILFGAVYEYFSHGVYSNYMIYAFLFPLIGGTLVAFLLDYGSEKIMPGRIPFNLYNSGIAALTMGNFFQGVLDIYGTTNNLVSVYWIVGAAMISLSIIMYIIGSCVFNKRR